MKEESTLNKPPIVKNGVKKNNAKVESKQLSVQGNNKVNRNNNHEESKQLPS